MADNSEEKELVEDMAKRGDLKPRKPDQNLKFLAKRAEKAMNYLQLSVAYILLVLFGVAVFDLGLKLYTYFVTGQIFQASNVIGVLETALLLFIIVEVFRTSVAHIEGLSVLPLVIDVALIGVARSLITYRVDAYESTSNALMAAGSYSIILLILVIAFYVIHRQKRKRLQHHRDNE